MGEVDKHPVDSTYMFDNNLFVTMCRDIDYFYKSKLINDTEFQTLQGELLVLVDFLEDVTRTGVTKSGGLFHLYIIPFDMAANYVHLEFDNNAASFIHIHSITYLRSLDPAACNLQKEWINQLKRYSVFITQSGEMQRSAYFKKQREYISQIGTTNVLA